MDMVLNPELPSKALQPFAISLAFARQQVGMGRTNDTIKQVWMGCDDVRQRSNRGLDALARRKQAKRHQHLPLCEAELGLELRGPSERAVRHAVRDQDDLVPICAKHFFEQIGCALRHHYQL